jgi:hypothetical protein
VIDPAARCAASCDAEMASNIGRSRIAESRSAPMPAPSPEASTARQRGSGQAPRTSNRKYSTASDTTCIALSGCPASNSSSSANPSSDAERQPGALTIRRAPSSTSGSITIVSP